MLDAKRLIDQFLGAGGSANLQQTLSGVLGQGGGKAGDFLSGKGGSLARARSPAGSSPWCSAPRRCGASAATC